MAHLLPVSVLDSDDLPVEGLSAAEFTDVEDRDAVTAERAPYIADLRSRSAELR